MSRNLRNLLERGCDDRTLFEALTDAAHSSGSPADSSLEEMAQQRGIAVTPLVGSRSFYDFLKLGNRGKRAYLCGGTVCRMSPHRDWVADALAEQFSQDEIGEMACVGHCYQGGGFCQDGHSGDHADLQELTEVGALSSAHSPPFRTTSDSSLFADSVGDLTAFYQQLHKPAGVIRSALDASGIRGRGGAGFPFARKLESCAEAGGDPKYVVCNADEGDPGAFSDRWLLEQQPHRVLGGMLAAGLAIGADSGLIYLRAEYPEALERVEQAIKAYQSTPAASESGFRFRLILGAGSYVCGEETALLNSIEGLRPEVRTRPPYPAQQGLFGKPTLLSNVETFAAIPWILARGGEAFAAIGTARSSGTKLVSLDHNFNQPGVLEVAMGTPLSRVVHELGGGFRQPVKALQIGGPLGGVIPIGEIDGLTLDFESLEQAGFLLGHASIVAIPEQFPMLELLRHLFKFVADESCGKCVPCRVGSRKGERLLLNASQQKPIDRQLLDDLLETMALGSLCALGGGLPLPIRNILEHFSDELQGYLA
ncbi:MAG: formate dehydrogenase [Gammaproteobacteria bacterium]|nr:formate dehydrogenase [Gammaproteobacteria bacterium]